uniref:Uncharacterized protein n=1 Tax=Aegilops tauschii subsp. strangulata TaxID=200361 RepID=A0A452YC05_AEGTS
DGVHLPRRVVVVDDVEVSPAAARHPLHQLHAEVIERDGHLHPRVREVPVAVPQQHHLVVVGEVAVGHGDARRPHDGVHQPVRAPRQRAVVHPHVPRREERDAVAVRPGAPPVVRRRRPHVRVPRRHAVVHVQVVDDHVGHVLQRDARAAGDVHVRAAPVDGLVAVHQQLLVEADGHVRGEHDPQRALLDGGVPERAGRRVHGVAVRGVGHNVERPALAAQRVAAEPDAAVRQPLPVLPPVRPGAPPAVVDRVASHAPAASARLLHPPPRRRHLAAHANANTPSLRCERSA